MTFREEILYKDKRIIAEVLEKLVNTSEAFWKISESFNPNGESQIRKTEIEVESDFLNILDSAKSILAQLENQES